MEYIFRYKMEIKPKQITWAEIPKDWMVQPKYDGECNKLIIKNGKANLQRKFQPKKKIMKRRIT